MGVADEVGLKFLSTCQGKPRRANEVRGIGKGLHRGLVGFVTIGPCRRDIIVHVGVAELHAAAVSVSEVWPVAAWEVVDLVGHVAIVVDEADEFA